MVTVTINGRKKQYPEGISYEDIAKEYQPEYGGFIALAAENGKIRELFKPLKEDCNLDFFTFRDDIGYKTYVRTATMLFLKAVSDLFGTKAAQNCRVECAIGNGQYIWPQGKIEASSENAVRIAQKMRELVAGQIFFRKKSYSLEEAIKIFK